MRFESIIKCDYGGVLSVLVRNVKSSSVSVNVPAELNSVKQSFLQYLFIGIVRQVNSKETTKQLKL